MLRFEVQGSVAKPYRVTFEHEGAELRVYCSCPSGDRRAAFCKHAAALLMGDVSNLVSGKESMNELERRRHGSPLYVQALTHQASRPKSAPPSGLFSLEDVVTRYGKVIGAKNLVFELTVFETGGGSLAIGIPDKKGRVRAAGRLSLSNFPTEVRWNAAGDAEVEVKAARPWCLQAPRSRRDYSSLDRAIVAFEEALQAMPAHTPT